jgi:hypothetical protein
MRRFEARFRRREDDDYVIVAYLVWDKFRIDAPPRIEPASSLRGLAAPYAILTTLRHLVRIKGARSFERLANIPTTLWSFVEVPALPEGVAR